jgi:hypothetical protein
MDTPKQEEREEIEFKLDKKYFEKILNKIDWQGYEDLYKDDKLLIALLAQNNLLLDKLCHIMMIATGLKPHDIPTGEEIDNESLKLMMGKSTMCGKCGRMTVPDQMGYCPHCKHDLRNQIAAENL